MYGTWTLDEKDSLEVSWRKNNIPVEFCESHITCPKTKNVNYYIIHDRHSQTSYISKMKILNVSIEDEGLHVLKYVGMNSPLYQDIMRCLLRVYAKGYHSTCSYSSNTARVYIACIAKGVYPSSSCVIINENQTFNGHTRHDVSTATGNKGKHFNTMCNIILELSNLTANKDVYNVTVNLYPNITNTDEDHQYGTRINLQIHKERPKLILENCPSEVYEGSEVTCVCKDVSAHPEPVVWYNGSSIVSIETKNKINFIAMSKTKVNYTCQTNTLADFPVVNIVYTLKILASTFYFYSNVVNYLNSKLL
ncbi:uncharacterized protein LOC129922971 [Biomphalaria glabrata]|uniref:Uncharacterized protein LOC129922971 n=1 Tax=Biomphalaria glabrata TaxID=6526 RepID=A0A9W2YX74_BIOGL|nr:uncharacterized protein LOC129922971 [Biomphalaria glabrata]